VKVMVDVLAAAPRAAVSVVVAAVPGVRFSVAGFAVTPVGKPLMVTATGAAKPLTAVAVRDTCAPVPPLVAVTAAGAACNVKSGGGMTVALTDAACDNMPEVPVKVIVAAPGVAVMAAVSATICAVPGVRLRVEGFAVTPEGRPPMTTATVPLNPLAAVAVTLTVWPVPPAFMLKVAGVADSEKSAVAAPGLELLLQDVRAKTKAMEIRAQISLRMAGMEDLT
jgi:hypothetical protein